jgi:uncharacterized protein DUF6702
MPAPWSIALALSLAAGGAHPMHTAVAELREAAGGRVEIRVRLYADDLRLAVPGAGTAAADSALSRYVRGAFALDDRVGHPLPFRYDGAASVGDVVMLTLSTAMPSGLAGVRVTNLLLCERFEDQVNIVRASYGGRTVTLLFIPGASAKALP